MPVEKPREIAAGLLAQVSTTGLFIEDALDRELDRNPLHPVNRALCQELVYGVLRWQARLDWIIARYTQNRTQKQGLQILLRLALYQLFFLDRIPPHAAVNEAVEQARRTGFGPQSGFINAVLRQALRDQALLRSEMQKLEDTDPATAFSHPAWLVDRWIERHGRKSAIQMMQANNRPSRTFARLNTLKTDPDALLSRWREEGVDYDFRTYPWTGENLVFCLKKHPPIARLGSFKDGWFYVQDPSTLLAVHVLDPKPGHAVLDLCAAPGGKTTFIAQRMRNEGMIAAQDRAFDRLPRIRENCARLGVTIVQTSKADGVIFPELNVAFDRILVDAPCSNTGVIGRRLELRHRIRPEEVLRLQAEQLEILAHAAPLLKPGGILVYSTCSVEQEENQDVVRLFLERHPDYSLAVERVLLPGAGDHDGAYVAELVRK